MCPGDGMIQKRPERVCLGENEGIVEGGSLHLLEDARRSGACSD